jgi:hypothetical protein
MRTIGKRSVPHPRPKPSAAGLRAAAVHQRTCQALAAIATNGILKGIYRFKTHEEMNRFDEEAQARAIARNLRVRRTKA